nr:zinc finger, CCHC-type [Tanacetum cinerariifolium]
RVVLRGTQKAALQWMSGKKQSKEISNGQVLCVYPNTVQDAILDENRFLSIPKPSRRSLINRTDDDIDVSEVLDKVNLIKKLSLRFFMKDMGDADAILVSTPMDTSKKLRTNNGQVVSQLEYSRVIGCLMYAVIFTRPDIAFAVCKLSRHLGVRHNMIRELIMNEVDGTIKKFKARLLIQGFRQKSRIDYFYTYALVARISTIRLLIALSSIHNLIIRQMDVKIIFLNGELEQEVYMNQPHGFIMPVSTPMDTSKKLRTNNGQVVSQLEYSRVIGCLMYISNLSSQQWQAIKREMDDPDITMEEYVRFEIEKALRNGQMYNWETVKY